MDDVERKEAYACSITYGTNNEFGFDYLRDNMKFDVESLVQPDHYFAIIDEVDSILIDEARTPLIISGASDEATDKYFTANEIIPQLERGHKDEETKVTTGDYLLDEKNHSSVLTEAGRYKSRETARRRKPLRPGKHGPAPLRRAGAEGSHALQDATIITSCRKAR